MVGTGYKDEGTPLADLAVLNKLLPELVLVSFVRDLSPDTPLDEKKRASSATAK